MKKVKSIRLSLQRLLLCITALTTIGMLAYGILNPKDDVFLTFSIVLFLIIEIMIFYLQEHKINKKDRDRFKKNVDNLSDIFKKTMIEKIKDRKLRNELAIALIKKLRRELKQG